MRWRNNLVRRGVRWFKLYVRSGIYGYGVFIIWFVVEFGGEAHEGEDGRIFEAGRLVEVGRVSGGEPGGRGVAGRGPCAVLQ